MHGPEKCASADYRSLIQGTEAVPSKFDWLASQLDSSALRERDELLLLREMHHRKQFHKPHKPKV